MSDVQLMLVIADAKSALERSEETTLEGRLRVAMTAAANHWSVLEEDTQFRGAVAAVYDEAEIEDAERIRQALSALNTLSAVMSGVPVDFEQILAVENPLRLMPLWREIKHPEGT